MDRWVDATSAVKQAWYQTSVVRREQSQKPKLSNYQEVICAPTLIPGHELMSRWMFYCSIC